MDMQRQMKWMAKPARIGFLPFYLKLYDDCMPERRPEMDAFAVRIANEFRRLGVDVFESETCRVAEEFKRAIHSFEGEGVDAIVTLHLAYSPSLESIDALASTSLPIMVLDTTPDYKFGPSQEPERIMFNHGIHGVQDFCNLLLRRGKTFEIEAGHWKRSDVLERICRSIMAAKMARHMKSARVGLIGEPFKGMGDFFVPDSVLKAKLGVDVVRADDARLRQCVPAADASEVEQELESIHSRFGGQPEKVAVRSVCAGLAVRRWIAEERLTAFSFNFQAFNPDFALPTVPFVEASLAMGRGIGYAGEGDVMTAALVGALSNGYPETTFTEMFCPDWKRESVFMSHMGEANLALLDDAKMIEYDFRFGGAENPLKIHGRLKAGRAVLVNLAPGPEDSFRLILAPVDVLGVKGRDRMEGAIRGWIRSDLPLNAFLAEYSRYGGTHHSALVYGAEIETLLKFAKCMSFEPVVLGMP